MISVILQRRVKYTLLHTTEWQTYVQPSSSINSVRIIIMITLLAVLFVVVFSYLLNKASEHLPEKYQNKTK